MAALGDFLRRAWIPLVTLVVVAGLTALGVQLRAGDRTEGAESSTQASTPGGQRQGGSRQGGAGRGGNAENLPREASMWPWWRDEQVIAELGLTAEKSDRIEEIYLNRANRMRPFAAERDREMALLNEMVRERIASPEAFELQTSKVESLSAELRKSRWVALYRLYRELEPAQYEKLRKIFDDRRASRGRGGPGAGS